MRRIAAAILIQNGTFLLQHRDANAKNRPNCWGFFGGHIETGEQPDETIVRELGEELCLQLVPAYFGHYVAEEVEGFVFVAVITESLAQLRKQQREGDDLGFFTLEETRSLALSPWHTLVLEEITTAMREGRLRL
jgi:8-oxo-dGTP diphosphatase